MRLSYLFTIIISVLILNSYSYGIDKNKDNYILSANSFITNTYKNDNYSTLILNKSGTNAVFGRNNNLEIRNFPVSDLRNETLILHKTRSITDANTEFVTEDINGQKNVKGMIVSSFSGEIANEPGSKVFLVSIDGDIFASIQHPDNSSFILAPMDVAKNDGIHVLISEKNIYSQKAPIFKCFNDKLQEKFNLPKSVNESTLSNTLLEVEIAVETDTDFFVAAGSNLQAAQKYALAVFSMVSMLYEEQVNITIYVPWIKCWTDSPHDPYNVNGNAYILPDTAVAYWKLHYQDVHRDLAHVMTSISYGGGGFGYLNVLCADNGYGMAVSSVQGKKDYPTFAFTYDVYIVAHEVGHNFNAQHTHSCYWGYPLDTCIVDEGIAGKCLDSNQKPLPNPGSIMSYCGGTNNSAGLGYWVRMIFLPQNELLIRKTAEEAQCLNEPLQPKVVLLQPHGSEVFNAKDTINIAWTSARVNLISLDYSLDNGTTWSRIDSNISAADKSYIWQIPDVCSNKAMIRITDASNPSTLDTSKLVFSIMKKDTEQLVVFYPFNANANDEHCRFYDAQPYSKPVLTTDRFNTPDRAYQFDGSSYLYANGFNAEFNALTVSIWFNESNGDGKQNLIGTNYEEGWVFEIYNWGQIGVSYYIDGQGTPQQIWGGGATLNKWNHLVFTYDGTLASIYINGVKKNSQGTGTHTLDKFASTPLYIGSRKMTDYFKGKLDDIRIYNRAISEIEIQELYNEHPTAVENDGLNQETELMQNSPNPANETTEIMCRTNQESNVRLSLYDLLGTEVLTIYEGNLTNGQHNFKLNTQSIQSGVYFYKLQTTTGTSIMKMIVAH